jgi:hypothetical protein
MAAVPSSVWLGGDAFVTVLKVPALRPKILAGTGRLRRRGLYQALSYWAIRRGAFGGSRG